MNIYYFLFYNNKMKIKDKIQEYINGKDIEIDKNELNSLTLFNKITKQFFASYGNVNEYANKYFDILNLFLDNIKEELKEDLNDNISKYNQIIKLIFIKEEYDSKFDISKSFQFIKLLNYKSIYYILSDLIQEMDSEFYKKDDINDIIFIILLLQGIRNKKFLKLVEKEKGEVEGQKSIIYELSNQIDKILDYIDKNKNMKANMTYAMKTKNQKIPNEIIKYIQEMIAKDETVIKNKLKDKLKKLKDIIDNRISKLKSSSNKVFSSQSHGLSYNDIKKKLSSQKRT